MTPVSHLHAAPVARALLPSVEWAGGDILIVDQTELPAREVVRRISGTAALAEAIERLRVRGAPALGIAGAYGVAQAALRSGASGAAEALAAAEAAGDALAATRPTAVNLRWAIERVLRRARAVASAGATEREIVQALLDEARAVQREDAEACLSMSEHAQAFISERAVVLTHCNTGALCTGGYGTALGAIRLAHERGKNVQVLACETRPLLQGARLTAWELGRLGVPHALVADGAAAGLIARGDVSAVLVGADRIVANGDTANKVGTYAHALAAREAGIPFVVVAPTTTIDLATPEGSAIPIEERAATEVTEVMGRRVAPPGTRVRNPAFDVTPARMITAIVTERGVARPPFGPSLAGLLLDGRVASR